MADPAVRVGDAVSHQLNLHRPGQIRRHYLGIFVSTLTRFGRDVGESLHINCEQMEQWKALVQFQALLPHYERWRNRKSACLRMGHHERHQHALCTVKALLDVFDEAEKIPLLTPEEMVIEEEGVLQEDGSNGSIAFMVRLLRLRGERDVKSKQPSIASGNSFAFLDSLDDQLR